jgi:hypothetical protein
MSEDAYASDKSAPADRRTSGPLDVSEVQGVRPYIDFGSLRIPSRDNLQMRLEVEEATQRIVAVSMDYEGSSLQLQAFAAPKTEGICTRFAGKCGRVLLPRAVTQKSG